MKKINTDNWKPFVIGDLFDIHPTKAYKKTNKELFVDDGVNPVVVNSAFNNGIGGLTNLDNTEKGNMITFSDTVDANTIFYQKKPFVGYPHVQGLYPKKFIDKWNKNTYLFFVSIFRDTALTKKFDFVNKFTRTEAKSMSIKLPTTQTGEPDWAYMEDYIKNQFVKSQHNLLALKSFVQSNKQKIDTSSWKPFHLYDIFDISMGNKMDKCDMDTTKDDLNFVGRSEFNNGVVASVGYRYKDQQLIEPYKAGNITIALGGSLGSAFIQQKDFYTSQNVCVLSSQNQQITDNVKYFIITMIKASCSNYEAFVEELNKHIRTDFTIKLPVTQSGEPDWDYMEQYIINLKSKLLNKLTYMKLMEGK